MAIQSVFIEHKLDIGSAELDKMSNVISTANTPNAGRSTITGLKTRPGITTQMHEMRRPRPAAIFLIDW